MERAREGALHCFIEVAMSDDGPKFDGWAEQCGDYEALGYPETEAGELFELDHAAWLVRFVSDGIRQSARPLRAIQKDIRSATDNG